MQLLLVPELVGLKEKYLTYGRPMSMSISHFPQVCPGGYIIADHILHVSEAVTTLFIAVVIITKHKEISTGARKQFHKYRDYLVFITNSVLFFLIGIPLLTVEKAESVGVTLFPILVAPFAIVMISRAVVVYGRSPFLRIFRVRITLRWQNILTLGGLRGAWQ